MRWRFLLLGLPILAACSERDMCVSRATKDLRQVQGFIAEAEGNLSRGYAYEEKQYVSYDLERCGEKANGDPVYCRVPEVDTRRVPKAIDLDAEAAKLAALKKKEAQLTTSAEQSVAACYAAYPEG